MSYFDVPPCLESAIREDERNRCWEEINALIKHGDIGGNGWDQTAQRNGLILAANTLISST